MRSKPKEVVEPILDEHRAHLRLDYRAQASLWVLGTLYQGETRNISDGGLLFSTAQPLAPELELQQWRVGRVTFALPHFTKPLQQDARIAWAVQRPELLTGVQFLHALPKVALFVIAELRRRQLMGL